MLKSRANLFKRILSLALFAVMIFSMCQICIFAADNEKSTGDVTKKYIVPIASLESAAPLKSVKTAFSKAFGDSVVVTVNPDGTRTALIKCQHMVIDFMSKSYDANVASVVDADASTEKIEKATVISTKQEVYHAGLKALETTDITVPDEFTIPLNLDGDNSQKLSITVDFMDAFMGSGKPFSTKVTLTLDMDSAVIDVSELNALIRECEAFDKKNHTDDTLAELNDAIAKAKGVAANPKSFDEIKNTITNLNKAIATLKNTGADYTSVEKQPQVDTTAQATTQIVSSLKKAQSDDYDQNNSGIGLIEIISAVVLVAVIGICVWYFCFYKKRNRQMK